jgi:hypothetical protein
MVSKKKISPVFQSNNTERVIEWVTTQLGGMPAADDLVKVSQR